MSTTIIMGTGTQFPDHFVAFAAGLPLEQLTDQRSGPTTRTEWQRQTVALVSPHTEITDHTHADCDQK